MNLRSLNRKELWNKTSRLIALERKVLLSLLQHLSEIQRRHLYAEYGFNSLWDLLVRGHKYSEASAQRRVNSVYLLKLHPELEAKIESGVLNLTNLSAAYTCFKKNTMTEEERKALLQNLENKTTRQAQLEIAKVAPLECPADKEAPLDGEHHLYTFVVTKETHEMMEHLKAEFSHIDPNMSKNDILNRIAAYYFDHSERPRRQKKSSPPAPKVGPLTKAQKREIFERDGRVCSEPGCGSSHQLEIDHIVPRSFGGTNDPENLRVMCRAHNLMHARNWCGAQKMEQYMRH